MMQFNPKRDTLILRFSNKKPQIVYRTGKSIVRKTLQGEPVLLEIFNGSELVKGIYKALPKKLREEFLASA